MTKAEISTIERFIRMAKSHDTVTMNPDTIGAVVQMIYEIWQAKDTAIREEIKGKDAKEITEILNQRIED